MTLITLRDVGVAYDGYEALEHVDLEIGEHDFLGVIGPNGGGKTTLVRPFWERYPTRERSATLPSCSAAESG